jgi:hypothetical protein
VLPISEVLTEVTEQHIFIRVKKYYIIARETNIIFGTKLKIWKIYITIKYQILKNGCSNNLSYFGTNYFCFYDGTVETIVAHLKLNLNKIMKFIHILLYPYQITLKNYKSLELREVYFKV